MPDDAPSTDPAPVKLDCRVERLPLFCRLYRGAFKSGHGGSSGPLRQLLSRIAYYTLDTLGAGGSDIDAVFAIKGDERRARLNGRNRQFNALYFHKYRGAYEPAVLMTLRDFYADDMVLLDIGSNWGYFSVWLASRPGFRGSIHAFEPMPTTFADLSRLVADLQLGDQVTCHELALGAKEGQSWISQPRHSGLATVNDRGVGEKIEVKPIDGLDFERVDFVKLDVEGFEPDVIRGGSATLERCRPVLVFESNTKEPSSAECLQLLRDLRYAFFIPCLGREGSSGLEIVGEYEHGQEDLAGLCGCYCPFSPRYRKLFQNYLNLVAVPEERVGEYAFLTAPSRTPTG